MGWQFATQSTQLAQNKAKKNETAAGVALVLAAAVGFTMCVGHQLLGEEGVGQLHQHLVAPVPDRRPAWTPSMLNHQLDLNTLVGHFLAVTYVRVRNFVHLISSLLMTSEWPLVKLESFSSFTGVLTRIQSRAWQLPLSSCSSLTTSTWLAQRGCCRRRRRQVLLVLTF